MHYWQIQAFVKNMTWMKVIFQSVALAFLHDTARVFVWESLISRTWATLPSSSCQQVDDGKNLATHIQSIKIDIVSDKTLTRACIACEKVLKMTKSQKEFKRRWVCIASLSSLTSGWKVSEVRWNLIGTDSTTRLNLCNAQPLHSWMNSVISS